MLDIVLDDTQCVAVETCCDKKNRIVAVTGPAGSGKTTLLKQVHEFFNVNPHADVKDVVLCAPTGKAAKRIKEATGIDAMTIHRLLEYPYPGERDPNTGKVLVSTDPKRCRRNPLPYKVVLADEYPMVNDELHRNLLDALPYGGIIRMFGDINQLEPIEKNKRIAAEGSPFKKILENKAFPSIHLKTIHRQAEGSTIISNCNRVISGMVPIRTPEFKMTITDEPVRYIEDIIMAGVNGEGQDYSQLAHQIISPSNQGWIGTVALNGMIQGLVQPSHAEEMQLERHQWSKSEFLRVCIGDKIIFTVNNYGLDVFNGESGIVKQFDEVGGVIVDFGDKIINIPVMQEYESKNHGTVYFNPQKDIDLSYVITTHKAQGSEYETGAYVMNRSRSFNLNRKNLYTGLSRFRKMVTLITDQKGLMLSLAKKGNA